MTRTEERLADALAAKARTVPVGGLCRLIVPPGRPSRASWVAPVAAAVGVALVVGLAVLSGWLAGSGHPGQGLGGQGAGLPRYYVEVSIGGGRPVVRSTATGAVTATVPVPQARYAPGQDIVAHSPDGRFLVAAFAPGAGQEQIYQFRLTRAGRVTDFAREPGGILSRGQYANALAASADGAQIAVGVSFYPLHVKHGVSLLPPADQILIFDPATGARSVWRGASGLAGRFSVESLSWTRDGRELVYLGQWCRPLTTTSESCYHRHRTAELRALDPASGGGHLDSGRLLLGQSARFPYLVQALISPDGSTITAVALTGPVINTNRGAGFVPSNMSVEQVSVTTGQVLRVLYHRKIGISNEVNNAPDFLALSQDPAAQHWMLNVGICTDHCTSGFNGWIRGGTLVPLAPVNGREADEAW
jgi:hypothetical protein